MRSGSTRFCQLFLFFHQQGLYRPYNKALDSSFFFLAYAIERIGYLPKTDLSFPFNVYLNRQIFLPVGLTSMYNLSALSTLYILSL